MKGKIPGLIKRIIAALSSKTNELRTRVMIFILLHSNQNLLMDKFHAIVAGHHHRRHAHRNAAENSIQNGNMNNDDVAESFIMYMNTDPVQTPNQVFSCHQPQENREDRCIDLTQALLKESEKALKLTENEEGTKESVSKGIESTNTMLTVSEDENLNEEDIDHAADLFIERFRRQIQLQKQLSLQERNCRTGMLQPNV